MSDDADEVRDWWRTSIIDMQPGVIRFRGFPVEELIGNVSFPAMIWLLVAGRLPNGDEAELLEAALVAAVDHGPQAPSIAAARSAVTCGLALNNAMGSAVNMLGDVHGGAGQQALELYYDIAARIDQGAGRDEATRAAIENWQETRGRFIPGFGHRFHKDGDPRAPRLMAITRRVAARGGIPGRFADIGEAVERALARDGSRIVPMNTMARRR